jgi:tRNAThr (cytosine32-N3)-methyltransferase
MYESPPCGFISASVWDLSTDSLPEGIEPGTVDIAVLIFVLSALHPDEWYQSVLNVHKVHKSSSI